jgi:hypothetical protein
MSSLATEELAVYEVGLGPVSPVAPARRGHSLERWQITLRALLRASVVYRGSRTTYIGGMEVTDDAPRAA